MKEDSDIASRISFLRITDVERRAMREVWEDISGDLESILDGFYKHLRTVPDLSTMLGDQQGRLIGAQSRHWARLFSGRFDDEYVASIRQIGLTHHRIGLEPRWYMGGYAYVLDAITALLVRRNRLRASVLATKLRAVHAAIMLDMDFAISVYQEVLIADRQKRGQVLSDAVDSFSESIGEAMRVSSEASEQLDACAVALQSVTEQSKGRVGEITSAADETARNIQAGAAATEELTASIGEIGDQSARSADMASRATQHAGEINVEVTNLADRANEIGEVVGLISDIAEQTNLLALNATIEAARAGESGRGFAVVAQEVKALAGQTAKATSEIATRITSIQEATSSNVERIGEITRMIEEISTISASIAAAVEQQSSATNDIAKTVQITADNTQSVSSGMTEFGAAVASTDDAAKAVFEARSRLDEQFQLMQSHIDRFLETARAA